MEQATKILANWAIELNYDSIPPTVVKQAKNQLFGLIGAALAAVNIPPGERAISAVKAWGDKAESTVWGTDLKSSMRSTAFLNSILSQLLEYEDALFPYAHVGSSIIPTALAVGEVQKNTGKELIEAIIVGDEVGGRVGEAVNKGIRMGNAIPVYQVTVPYVAGKLMKLDMDTYLDAIGGSLTQAQVTILSGWVSHSKAYLSAMPVLAGVTATCVAREGFTGFHEPLEDPLGYVTLVCERPEPEALTQKLGETWLAERLIHKPYPVCGWMLAQVEAVIDLMKENEIDLKKIKDIIVKVPTQAAMAGSMWREELSFDKLRNRHDWSYIPLMFDLSYPVAAAAVDGELTPRQWMDDRLFDSQIHEVLGKIKTQADIMLTSSFLNEDNLGAIVTINMEDGVVYEKTVETVKGSLKRPYDVSEKFRKEALKVLPEDNVNQAIDMINNLESVQDTSELCQLLVVS